MFWGSLRNKKSRLSREVARRVADLKRIYAVEGNGQAEDLVQSIATFQSLQSMTFLYIGQQGCSARKASALARSARSQLDVLEKLGVRRESVEGVEVTGKTIAARWHELRRQRGEE
jgi:hypothetical protein